MPKYKPDAPTTYVACCSFGKDSLATVLLALKHREPLDHVVFVEVMYDKVRGISGEDPEQAEWIHQVAIPGLEAMGCKVEVLRSEIDYRSCFFTRRHKSGKYEGKLYGFVVGEHCWVNRDMKLHVLRHYYSQFKYVHEYVGIAADEVKRLARLKDGSKIKKSSLLAKYNVTEAEAMEMCREAGLLSPIYEKAPRSGCWFCPTKRMSQYREFRREHPELWNELRDLAKRPGLTTYNFSGRYTIEDLEQKFNKEQQICQSKLT